MRRGVGFAIMTWHSMERAGRWHHAGPASDRAMQRPSGRGHLSYRQGVQERVDASPWYTLAAKGCLLLAAFTSTSHIRDNSSQTANSKQSSTNTRPAAGMAPRRCGTTTDKHHNATAACTANRYAIYNSRMCRKEKAVKEKQGQKFSHCQKQSIKKKQARRARERPLNLTIRRKTRYCHISP